MNKKYLFFALVMVFGASKLPFAANPPGDDALEDLPDLSEPTPGSAEPDPINPQVDPKSSSGSGVQSYQEQYQEKDSLDANLDAFEDAPKSAEAPVPTESEKVERTEAARPRPSPTLYAVEDPGAALDPVEQFGRIPLKPQMSDTNWRKWAGPAIEKNYNIRRGDTLWGISERLFGNPFLWPKVWQLNAVLGNPNIIPKGLEMTFVPGNPNSAPSLAFESLRDTSSNDLPVMLTTQRATLMDELEGIIRAQNGKSRPPFKYFLLSRKPEVFAKVRPFPEAERIYYGEGDSFRADCEDGDYSIIRILPRSGKNGAGHRVRWLGSARVHDEVARVGHAYFEIEKGDLLVKTNFLISPLALHEEKIQESDTGFIPLEEGQEKYSAEMRMVGARFDSLESGPRPGAIVEVKRGHEAIARLLLVNRDRNFGTFWVIENKKEINIDNDRLGARD